MRILLFHPRGFTSTGADNRMLHSLACTMPPIGCASIAAVLRNAGHEVTIFDAALLCTIGNADWAQRIIKHSPDILGISAITASFLDGYDLAEKVKKLNDRIQIVFGGVHVSWGKEQILKDFPAIDYIIAGEGEYSFRKLADGCSPQSIEGLYFRNGPAIEHGPAQTACELDDLPFPAYDLLEGFPKRYLMPLFSYTKHPGANVISSRGCVYQCSYCDRSVFGKSFRFNSPSYTAELVAWLAKDFGVRHVNFYDDLFTLNRERVQTLCELLVKSKKRVSFNCIVRLGHVDKDLIALLKQAGCYMVNVGIESGDQAILDKHKAGLSLEAMRTDINKLVTGGLRVKGLFVMGFPGETIDSIQKTKKFALSLPLSAANCTAFTPFPGAPITQTIRDFGTFENDWSKLDCEQFVFIPKEIESKEVIESLYRDFIKSFYQSKDRRRMYLQMLFESPHSYYRLLKNAAIFLSYAFSMNKKTSP